MEPQVIITLAAYNDLVAFKKQMEKEHYAGKIHFYHGHGGTFRELEIYGKSDIIEGLKAEIEERDKTISEQWKRIWDLEGKHEKKKKWWQW